MLFNRCIMAETKLSRDYDRKQLELLKKGALPCSARFYAARYARAKERKRNADKSGG
jgi:hypothetical protein